MKKLLTILLLMAVSFCGKAQAIFPTGQPRQINYNKGGSMIDSIFVLPVRDTIGWSAATFRSLGRLTVRPQDSLIYYFKDHWVPIAGGGVDASVYAYIDSAVGSVSSGAYTFEWGTINTGGIIRVDTGAGKVATKSDLTIHVKYTDTGTMLVPYLRKIDTAGLSARINLKQNFSDTSTWDATRNWVFLQGFLTTYSESDPLSLHTGDTSVAFAPYYRIAGYGLLGSGHTVYVDTLFIRTVANSYNKSQVDGMVAGKQNISDTSAWDATRSWVLLQGFMTTYSETDPLSVKIADSADMLLPYLRLGDSIAKYVTPTRLADTAAAIRAAFPVGGTSTFDQVLAAGNTATDKDAIINMTGPGTNVFRITYIGDTRAQLMVRNGAGSLTVTNAPGTISSSLNATQLTLGNVGLNPGQPGTIATTSGVQTLTNQSMSGIDNTFTDIPNSALVNNSISGIPLGSNLASLTFPANMGGDVYNGSFGISPSIGSITTYGSANQFIAMNTGGTQYEYKTFAVGTSGTDFAIAHTANTITFNLPTASASARGALSSANWTTFNNSVDPGLLTGSGLTINTGRLAGRTTASAGAIEEITPNATLSLASGGIGINLSNANTWSAAQTFGSGFLKLNGSSSGTGTLNAPAVASTYTWTLPAATTTLAGLSFAQSWTAVQTFSSSPVMASITNGAATITIPTVTGTAVQYAAGTTTGATSPLTPAGDARQNTYTVTSLAANATVSAPTGTPVDGNMLILRLKDNGASKTLTWNAIYRGGTSIALPSATTLGKTMYLWFQYNSADTKWDLILKTDGI